MVRRANKRAVSVIAFPLCWTHCARWISAGDGSARNKFTAVQHRAGLMDSSTVLVHFKRGGGCVNGRMCGRQSGAADDRSTMLPPQPRTTDLCGSEPWGWARRHGNDTLPPIQRQRVTIGETEIVLKVPIPPAKSSLLHVDIALPYNDASCFHFNRGSCRRCCERPGSACTGKA
ncbi:hypothetical protein BV22DRAFT_891565 [Leucogyrophana mollusca]|uniref:Uncharacterized protein n=1 Tax=Leucogyrophana mollusca TaxID=85980 RepID=A0ACB8B103_9AGAM|nr:hypothetical protein BV22DRAFT_891565 [Leucogyrophana mollusca]